jgi:hypothetical protein
LCVDVEFAYAVMYRDIMWLSATDHLAISVEKGQVSCMNSFCACLGLQCNRQAHRLTNHKQNHLDHKRRQKWSLLLCMHSLHLCKMLTFICWNSFWKPSKLEI